jgi:hypothetical protein
MAAGGLFKGSIRDVHDLEIPTVDEARILEVDVDGNELKLTVHALRRMHQRGVASRAVLLALQAKPVIHGGDLIYRITDRFLIRSGLTCCADRLRGLTVVVRPDGVIRTVKWDYRRRRIGPLRRSACAGVPPRCRCPRHAVRHGGGRRGLDGYGGSLDIPGTLS